MAEQDYPVDVVPHGNAYRIESDEPTEYGVLVQCGPREHPYWWLLCPGTATLYLEADGHDDCSDGSCVWDEVHERAGVLRRTLGELVPVAGSATDGDHRD